MKRLAAALLLALATQAQALEAPAVIGLHLHSAHGDDGKQPSGSFGWNDNNLGAYARWSNGATVGAYRNSLSRDSVYAGWTLSDSADRFAITLGAVSGYDKLTGDTSARSAVRCDVDHGCREVHVKSVILPLIVPSVRIGITERFSARLSALVQPGFPWAIHLSVEWRLK